MLDKESERHLEKFYRELYDSIEKKKKKLLGNSIILTFFKTNSNNRSKFLNSSAIPAHKIQKTTLDELEKNGLVRSTNEPNNYVITCRGIWFIESNKNHLKNEDLIDYIDSEYFNLFERAKKPLRDTDKIILFSMISARTFSENSPVDLSRSDRIKDAWAKILKLSYQNLLNNKIVQPIQNFLESKGNVHPVSDLFRHATELPKLTKSLYVTTKDYKYFLNLNPELKFDKNGLVLLIKTILNNKELSTSELEKINEFCAEIAHNESSFVLDPKKNIFWEHKYDDIVREALFLS